MVTSSLSVASFAWSCDGTLLLAKMLVSFSSRSLSSSHTALSSNCSEEKLGLSGRILGLIRAGWERIRST